MKHLPVLSNGGRSPVTQAMPSLYAAWLRELGLEMPVEELATCSNCPMCVDNPAEPESVFDPSVKCCSYNPVLPNFLVGMILADDDPAGTRGRESVRVRMRDRSATTPLGVGFRADLRLIYETGNVFGRSPTHRCPHYMDGLCGIWPYRNSVCSTWFCKHVRGRAGQRAWVKLRDLLAVVEADLALVCALEVDRVEDIGLELGALHAKPSREAVTQAAVPVEAEREFKARWSTWADRVDEFYMKCATVAREMTWADVERSCGVNVRAGVRAARSAYADMARDKLPDRLVPGRFTVSAGSPQELRVVTYSPYDPLTVSKDLLSVLPYFSGDSPTNMVLTQIAERESIDIDEGVLRKMVDYGLLRPA